MSQRALADARARGVTAKSLGTFPIGPKERQELGHLSAWARAARDVYDLYCKAIEKNPDAVLTITVTSA